jgi:putative flippase GtrA
VVRYGLTGLATFALEYSLLLTLVEVAQFDYQLGNALAFVLANLFNYVLSRYWVFTRGKHATHVEMIAYFLGAGVGLLINVLVMGALVEYAALDYRVAKIFAIGAIVVWNFWSRKKLIFKG